MNDLNIIDQFTLTFVTFIDSGFGLLSPDVAFLTTILIGIDITLAGLFWALAEDKSVIPALIKKVLYIGTFAYIINNFSFLSNVIFKQLCRIRPAGHQYHSDHIGFNAARFCRRHRL